MIVAQPTMTVSSFPAQSAPNSLPAVPQKVRLYTADRIIGSGSFGVVYEATERDTGKTVAIKKVYQDPRFVQHELDIVRRLAHPNIVPLHFSFFTREGEQQFLNLVMERGPDSFFRRLRRYERAGKALPLNEIKICLWGLLRALAYTHAQSIVHRDVSPQNILYDFKNHTTYLCDFGSAKLLTISEPTVTYMCKRSYRAPELLLECATYSTHIDLWSVGCILGEALLGQPLFCSETPLDHLIEIIKVLGSPNQAQLAAMAVTLAFKITPLKPTPWTRFFEDARAFRLKDRARVINFTAIDLVARFLKYEPHERLDALAALAHPFFDDVRDTAVGVTQAESRSVLFNFTSPETEAMRARGLYEKIVPVGMR